VGACSACACRAVVMPALSPGQTMMGVNVALLAGAAALERQMMSWTM